MSLITEDNALGTGSASTFNFTFKYVKESDVYVSVDDVVQTLNTHYTFAPNTSSVTFLPAHIPANGAAVRIFRDTSISTPSAEFFPGSAIRAQDLNANNDQVLFSAQERKERSLDATGGSLTGQLDMQTNKIINLGTPTANADASTKAYVDSTVGTVSSYATSAAASAAAALASETAAGTSETNAATSETNAATSATNSATSATNSATSATASATSATAAATSETNAATSETNAATSATAASNSATSAASSAASALAAFDNFDDTYLGTKTSDPATDNDGDPLNAGDLYFNSTLGVMKVYTGSAWVIAYVPGDAANITSTATGDVAATNVQDAIAELDTEKVPRTSTTGSAKLPVGTTAQRDGSPAAGMIRYNSQTSSFEGYGSAWGAIGGGATGGGTDSWALEHDNTVTTSYTISTGKNVVSAGPVTINALESDNVTPVVVTVPSGSTWVIV